MMEVSGRIQTGSADTSIYVKCDPCLLLKKNGNAENYYVNCDEFFCGNCSSAHKLFKVSRNHKLLSQDDMPRQKLMSAEENFCPKHSEETFKYFCNVHNNVFCPVCVTLEHKNCPIEYIDDIAPGFETSPEFKSVTEKILRLLQELKDIKKISTRNSHDIKTVFTQFVLDVKTFRSEINNLLDSMETTVLKEAQNVKEFDLKAVQTVSTVCDTLITDVDKIVKKLEKQKQYKQQRQLVISAKKAGTQINEYEMKIGVIRRQSKVRNYRFQKNEKMLHSLELSMYGIGTLVDRGKLEELDTDGIDKGYVNDVFKDPKCIRASFTGGINISHSEDKNNCWIEGSTMIDQNRLALTDHDNSSVKIVDVDSKTILSCLKIPFKPWDVTCIDKSQLVISCDTRLVFVNVGQTLTVKRELRINGDCRGIIYDAKLLFVSFESSEPGVKLVKLNGSILMIFSNDTIGQLLFEHPRYICLSRSKSTLFVLDTQRCTVTSMDRCGRVQNVYKDTRLKSPSGLTVDRYDNIYIAGQDSNNILQISRRCGPIQILLDETHGMKQPRSLTYCETENKLFIGHAGPERKFLSVCQL